MENDRAKALLGEDCEAGGTEEVIEEVDLVEEGVGEEVKTFDKTEYHLDSKDLNENKNPSISELDLNRQKDSTESDNEVFTHTSESETAKSNSGSSTIDTKSKIGSVETGQKTKPHSKPIAMSEVRVEKWEKEEGQEVKEKMEVDGEGKERGRQEKKVGTEAKSSTPVAPSFGAHDIRYKEVKLEEIPKTPTKHIGS